MLIGHLGIEPTGPTAGMYRQMTQPYKGGITSFMAGVVGSIFGDYDASVMISCPSCVTQMISGHSTEDWYKRWLTAHHVLTGDDSWYGGGFGAGVSIAALLTAGGAGEADAAEIGDAVPDVIRAGDLKLPGVPKGSSGLPVDTGKGLQYTIPRGTPEIDPRVTGIRIMNPVTSGKYQYPNGYASYMNASGQTVNPLTGQTVTNSDPFAHIPLP